MVRRWNSSEIQGAWTKEQWFGKKWAMAGVVEAAMILVGADIEQEGRDGVGKKGS